MFNLIRNLINKALRIRAERAWNKAANRAWRNRTLVNRPWLNSEKG